MHSRVKLHPATPEDVDFIVSIDSNPDFWFAEDELEGDSEKVREITIDRMNGDRYKYFVIRLNDNRAIGVAYTWQYISERKSWEIGYCILPEYRRQGYCTEAARALIKYTFENCGAHRVVAMCSARNKASYRVLEKAGMTREGVFRQEILYDGGWVDQFFYAILDSEHPHILVQ